MVTSLNRYLGNKFGFSVLEITVLLFELLEH